ncbi:O-antigen ligase family protein [Candidatus Thioglobus sp.]|nr:O-antigen ligase family protein [Candidatus Thioglobus sp.]
MKMINQMTEDKYSYFVNAMLFLFALFVNINNTLADIALFSLFIAGVYILKKNNINLFKDSRLRIVLLITAGYYFINLVIFFINGTNFGKYLQTDIYFLFAVFVAAGIFYAKINMSLFFTGIRLALLFLGACQFLTFEFWSLGYSDFTNIYKSVFAPVTVLMMFLSIISYDNDNLINKLLGLTAFVFGFFIIIDSTIRLSWVVFIALAIVVFLAMFKKIIVNKFSVVISLLLLSLFLSFIGTNNTINNRITKTYNEIVSWSSGTSLDSSIGLRIEMYQSGLEAFKEKPFFGHGYLTGTKEASRYSDPRVRSRIFHFVQLHSEYITTMVEKGLFGLLSLGILLLSPIMIIIRNYAKDDIYIRIGVISSISFVLFGLLNVSFGDTTIKSFYVLLICLFLPKIFKERLR